MEQTQNTRQIVNTVFKAVAVGMSVAAIVLGALGTATSAAVDHVVEHRPVLSGRGIDEVNLTLPSSFSLS